MGCATAARALADGARVTIAGRTKAKLDAASEMLGSQHVQARVADMTDDAAVRKFAAGFHDKPVDALVVSASSVVHGSFGETPTDRIRAMVESKFLGPYVIAREMMSHMVDGGSITFFSGVLSRKPGSAAAGLAAVNAAVEGLTRALAKELAPRLRVNCISPGMTDTDAYAAMAPARREAMFRDAAKSLPLGRIGTPDDIARAVIFAMTNPFLTGHVLDVDGGHLVA